MLEEGLDRRVTLVSAPTGYGKTILLSHWLRSRKADSVFAWVSLDEQDDDPIRLWRHILESLGGVPQRVLLVLDDYQFATGEVCHEAMDIEHDFLSCGSRRQPIFSGMA